MQYQTSNVQAVHCKNLTGKMSDSKLERTISRFQSKIDSGSYYEAHQTLRTVINRYVRAEQIDSAIDLLYKGTLILSSKREYASASDLITYYITILKDRRIGFSDQASFKENKLKLIELVNTLVDSASSLPDISVLALAWSKDCTGSAFGDEELHDVFGAKFLRAISRSDCSFSEEEKSKMFAYAETHLILGTYSSLPLYVSFLSKWAIQEHSRVDAGVFLARAVINYTYLKNIKFAQEATKQFLNEIASVCPSELIEQDGVSIRYFNSPENDLLNFLQLLVITLSKEKVGGKFMKLYENYKNALTKYGLKSSVEYLGRFYFQLKLGNAQEGQNILSSLMGDFFK